jgi:cytochrome c peroxidase
MKQSLFTILLISAGVLLISASISLSTKKRITEPGLGKKLFLEKMLSKDSSLSCGSCHIPAFAFADTVAVSVGIYGKAGTRNTPSVLNMKNRPYYFWDGRAASLEEQALMPIKNLDEMGLQIAEAVERLNKNRTYRELFQQVYHQNPTEKNLAAALSAFEKTLETVNSKFDDWSNNISKLLPAEEAGRQLFVGDKAKCFNCHSMEDFTNDEYKNIGLYNGKELNDAGRYNFSKNKEDLGKFKTPGLRNVAVTAPYMHNGIFTTLEQVIDYYNNPSAFVSGAINIDETLQEPLGLTEKEKKNLVAFLKTLTDKKFRR